MQRIPGLTGNLVPGSYLGSRFPADTRTLGVEPVDGKAILAVRRMWAHAEEHCGAATSVRTLYDAVADPLFHALGFVVHTLRFERRQGTAVLRTPDAGSVALVLLPWASAPSSAIRDAYRVAVAAGTPWAMVLAPPYLSLLLVSAAATRRRLDFLLPAVFDDDVTHPFWTLLSARLYALRADGLCRVIDAVVARAAVYQDRVRRDLQAGVVEALTALTGVAARASIRTDATTDARGPGDARAQALTIVYRTLFLLFAESRALVPSAHPLFADAYSVSTLAREALDGATRGSWDALAAITRLARDGCRSAHLVMAPFGGALFARASASSLESGSRTRRTGGRRVAERDRALGDALVALASRPGRAGREAISYRDLGVEELGAVYERLLDLPTGPEARPAPPGRSARPAGSVRERKITGTFYTPQPLAEFIVRRTLSPLVRGLDADRILDLRVLDPAMGSGACLIAACRYLATAYEQALIDEGRATPDAFGEPERAEIRRLVGSRCLAGVDRNPTAVELARLSLWLATLAEGRPLGFLDHRLRVGDSLIGAWPDDLARLPARRLSSRELPLFDGASVEPALERMGPLMARLIEMRDDSLADVRAKAEAWRTIVSGASPLDPWRRALSFWCARWFWPGDPGDRPSPSESRAVIAAILGGDCSLPAARVRARLATALDVARTRQFFHWPLEFPDVFVLSSGEPRPSPGFDAVIGNPPWEMVRRDDGRGGTDEKHLLSYVRESGQFGSCRQGHLNLYQAFLDRALGLVRPGGRIGLVLPWGLACDDGAADLRRTLLESTSVNCLVGLDNRAGLFPIHRGIRYLVLTATSGAPTSEIRARFGVATAEDLESLPDVDDPTVPAYPVSLSVRRLRAVGGPLMRIPDVRQPEHLDIAEALATRFPPLGDLAGWHVSFGREANATEARPWIGGRGLPIVDGKHISPFVVTVDDSRRIDRTAAERLVRGGSFDRSRVAYRDVSGVGNALTLIAAVVPPAVVTTHTLFCLKTPLPLDRQHFLTACFNSWVLNLVVRLLMGNHVTTTLVESLPVPVWSASRLDRWIAATARRLSDTDADSIHARLQAAVAHRYGLDLRTFDFVLDAVPLVSTGRRRAARVAFEAADW